MTGLMIVETTLPGGWSDSEVLVWIKSAAGRSSCVHRSKVRSTYAWDGEVCDDDEWFVRMKVSPTRLDELVRNITEHHPYDVPMILTHSIAASNGYVEWAESSTIDE
tara:strand:- start:209 stop:529 length:321 start_codon:yes stop_codon:yes gene_type:complete